jgi:hypothetical protein
MWNWLKDKTNSEDCRSIQNDIEQTDGATGSLSAAQKQHLAECAACQTMADDILTTRALLSDMPPVGTLSAPWLAPRVMAAIAVRESEMRRSLEAWAAVPRFAARLSWVSALALLLASTWLYATPKSSTTQSTAQTTVESLFDSAQAPAPDEMPLAEHAE